MAVSFLTGGSMSLCPECDEVIGADDGCACASCGRFFHLECLDPDTLDCLDCAEADRAGSSDDEDA